jgi:hypothetical protein
MPFLSSLQDRKAIDLSGPGRELKGFRIEDRGLDRDPARGHGERRGRADPAWPTGERAKIGVRALHNT